MSPRRLDERMVVDAKGELIDIANKNYQDWKAEDKEFVQRDFVLRLEHFKELRRYSERKGTRLVEEDLAFDQDLLSKAVASGLFGTIGELAEKVARGEEETHRLGRTLDEEKKKESVHKRVYGYIPAGKSQGYDVDAARKTYREQGMSESDIDDKIKTEMLKLDGYEVCSVCKKVIDSKHGTIMITDGKCYCVGCYKGKEMLGKPYEINGVPIKCSVCGTQIKNGWTLWWECPEGENVSEKCTWWCRSCYFKRPDKQELKAKFLKKLNGKKIREEK